MRRRTRYDDIVQEAYNRALVAILEPVITKVFSDEAITFHIHSELNENITISLVGHSTEIGVTLSHLIRDQICWCIVDDNSPPGEDILIVHCGQNRAYIFLKYE
jgi:hypothetical protein